MRTRTPTPALDAQGLDGDPLLARLAVLTAQIAAAETERRRLIAFARECLGLRPYPLKALAAATGFSISGVRSAYSAADVDHWKDTDMTTADEPVDELAGFDQDILAAIDAGDTARRDALLEQLADAGLPEVAAKARFLFADLDELAPAQA